MITKQTTFSDINGTLAATVWVEDINGVKGVKIRIGYPVKFLWSAKPFFEYMEIMRQVEIYAKQLQDELDKPVE